MLQANPSYLLYLTRQPADCFLVVFTEKAESVFSASPSLGSFTGPPPPITDGRKSTMLAICPQLPPSMQRPEWCMDDYTIMDKLYTGYASTGVYVHMTATCRWSVQILVMPDMGQCG